MEKRISATVTRYEAEVDFSEAEFYDEFCAKRLAELFPGHEVDVTYGLQTRAYVYDSEIDQDDVSALLRVDLWDEFCESGYRQYSAAEPEQTGVVS